jgi:hypothetical protein
MTGFLSLDPAGKYSIRHSEIEGARIEEAIWCKGGGLFRRGEIVTSYWLHVYTVSHHYSIPYHQDGNLVHQHFRLVTGAG